MSGAVLTPGFAKAIEHEIDIDGTRVVVKTLVMDEILDLVGEIEPLQQELATAPATVMDALNGYALDGVEKAGVATWLAGLVKRQAPVIRRVLEICTGQPREFLGQLLPDRFMALLMLAVQANADFFYRALPAVVGLAEAVGLPVRKLLEKAAPPVPPAPPAPQALHPSTGPVPSSN